VSEELAHDAHLRAALRHAPDHALAPPSGLSQTILAAARQAHLPVRTSAEPPPVRIRPAGGRPLSLWLQRLFAPRWAGAWAAGLVAALGLGLWIDLGMEPVLDRPAAVATRDSAQTQTPSNAEGARPPSSPGDAAADSARLAALTKVQPPTPAERPAPPTATADATMPAARQRPDERSNALRREVDELSQRREAVAPRPAEKAARRAEATTAEAAVQGRVAAAPESKLSDPALGAPAAAAAPQSAAPPAPAVAQANAPPPAAALELHQGAVPRDARKAELGETVPAASPAFTLLRRAQAELATGSVRWTWAAPGVAVMAPFDDAAQAWLARVVQLARGRWVDVRERGESLDALEVRWWRDGWPHATLRIEAEGLRWIEPNGRIRYAPLDAATLQRVRNF
jgi:hypothetical protein